MTVADRDAPVRLGSLLELVHCALDQVTTFEAEFRDWTKPVPSLTVLVGRELDVAPAREPKRFRWHGGGPFPRPTQVTRHIWFKSPGSLRVEIRQNGNLVRLGIRDGSRWWRWDKNDGASAGDATGPSAGGGMPSLLDLSLITPARVLGWLRLEPAGAGRRAGRKVIVARGWPRQHAEPPQPIHQELEFDAEHGTMLRSATFVNGQRVQSTEATTIEYARRVDPARFVYSSPSRAPAQVVEDPSAWRG
jgi:hypothetical protein